MANDDQHFVFFTFFSLLILCILPFFVFYEMTHFMQIDVLCIGLRPYCYYIRGRMIVCGGSPLILVLSFRVRWLKVLIQMSGRLHRGGDVILYSRSPLYKPESSDYYLQQ